MTETMNASLIPTDPSRPPVAIKEEDFAALHSIQSKVDGLAKYRQEMGRLTQLIGNMREEANRVELELAEARRSLADKYNLNEMGTGQWALDFNEKRFIKVSPDAPAIP